MSREKVQIEQKALPLGYFQSADVVAISRDLLGKSVYTCIDGVVTGGIITETEAYAGPEDKASHSYGLRRTVRNEVMYGHGGHAYVYLCYGIHHLLNFVTGPKETPHGVLIRAIYPTVGIEKILERRAALKLSMRLTTGPGTVSQALGIKVDSHYGLPLNSPLLWVEDGPVIPDSAVIIGPRVGIDYAEEWKDRPWRFRTKL